MYECNVIHLGLESAQFKYEYNKNDVIHGAKFEYEYNAIDVSL